jgi:hypothetical protein
MKQNKISDTFSSEGPSETKEAFKSLANALMIKKMEKNVLTQIMEISEYKVEVKIKNLIKFYFFHFLYFFAAPFAIILIIIL